MNKEQTFNGFSNYETWAVSLWMDNDPGSYEHYRELARRVRDGVEFADWSEQRDVLIGELAAQLRADFEEGSIVTNEPSVYADLLNAALSEVDWCELAENLLDEVAASEAR